MAQVGARDEITGRASRQPQAESTAPGAQMCPADFIPARCLGPQGGPPDAPGRRFHTCPKRAFRLSWGAKEHHGQAWEQLQAELKPADRCAQALAELAETQVFRLLARRRLR